MFSSNERKAKRMMSGLPDSVSDRAYNFIIGGCILYGFIVNAIIVISCQDLFAKMNPWIFLIGYFVLCIAGSVITASSSNPFISFLGYNMIVVPIGALLSTSLPFYYIKDIIAAILVTAVVVAIMVGLSVAYPRFFAGLGRVLFFSLLIGLLAQVVALFLGYGGTIFNWLFVVIFSLYIGYDWFKAQSYPKTMDNAVDSAVDLYLDIVNLFLQILRIISKMRDN